MKRSEKVMRYAIGILFLLLYMLVATISAICSIDFFTLSHSQAMSICLAVAFELGAMCSLCAGVFMKSNRTLSFSLFTLLTLFQMMGNVFHSYTNLTPGFIEWINLFGLNELEEIAQKRVVAAVSGAVLPIVALGFIKCFVDYNDKQNDALEDKSVVIEEPVEHSEPETIKEPEVIKPEEVAEHIAVEPQPIVETPKVEEPKRKPSLIQSIIKPKEQPQKVEKKVEQPKKEEHKFVDVDPATMI